MHHELGLLPLLVGSTQPPRHASIAWAAATDQAETGAHHHGVRAQEVTPAHCCTLHPMAKCRCALSSWYTCAEEGFKAPDPGKMQRRQEQRDAYLSKQGTTNQTNWAAIAGGVFLGPAVVILGYAIASGYLDSINSGWRAGF